jgi:low temperature requirement protein LtrA
VIIAGILLTAVGDEIVIAHPTDELAAAEVAVVVGGPAVYLLAQTALRLRVTGRISIRRISGALACFVIAPIAAFAPALLVAGALLAVLIGVIVADQIVAARRIGGRTRARTA